MNAMRCLLVAMVALGLASEAGAGMGDDDTRCADRAQLAERIMRHRQDTNDLEATWRIAGDIRDPQLSRLGQALVFEAYQQTRHAAEAERLLATREFADEVQRACLAASETHADPEG
jgi:hypothetical protein